MDLRTVKTYIISPNTGKYKDRLQEVMRRVCDHGFCDVEHMTSVPDPCPTNSLSLTNLLIFEKEKDKNRPFLVLEDDIQFSHTDYHIVIPPNAVAIHLGVSIWVYRYGYDTIGTGKHIQPITTHDISHYNDPKLVRIRGMTSGHAILYVDPGYISILGLCIQSNIKTNTPHDIVMASLQHYFQHYALKHALFYQDAMLGGQERETHFIMPDPHLPTDPPQGT